MIDGTVSKRYIFEGDTASIRVDVSPLADRWNVSFHLKINEVFSKSPGEMQDLVKEKMSSVCRFTQPGQPAHSSIAERVDQIYFQEARIFSPNKSGLKRFLNAIDDIVEIIRESERQYRTFSMRWTKNETRRNC